MAISSRYAGIFVPFTFAAGAAFCAATTGAAINSAVISSGGSAMVRFIVNPCGVIDVRSRLARRH
jgi:hypothetical protein